MWAYDNDHIDTQRIITWGKKKGKLPRYFTKSQLVKIFEVIDRPKDAIACFMALQCGLRVNEICRLEIENVDFENEIKRVYLKLLEFLISLMSQKYEFHSKEMPKRI